MKQLTRYVWQYIQETDKMILVTTTLFTGFLIWANFSLGINEWISSAASHPFIYWYLIFLTAFLFPYLFFAVTGKPYFSNPRFILLALISPAIFALKMTLDTEIIISQDLNRNELLNILFYWPLRLFVLAAILFIVWKLFYNTESFFGLTWKQFNWKPYTILLLLMIPLIFLASTQPDFLQVYPKVKLISHHLESDELKWLYTLLFEISYGSDFISVELFFRGFLILAFARFAGKDTILPMACFYCTIHFGKPLGECISSYFGGILLGVVVYHTRSIYGGLLIHLGIAWLMELGGHLGNHI